MAHKSKKRPAKLKRRNDKFAKQHGGKTRKEWAKFKRENGLPKIFQAVKK